MVIQPVLDELQRMADSAEPMRRARGRRGLELLETLPPRAARPTSKWPSTGTPRSPRSTPSWCATCLDSGMALLTSDSNLAKAADLSASAS